MSARYWTHAGVRYRMPDYRIALALVGEAKALPTSSDLATQAGNAPMWVKIISACYCDDPALPENDPLDALQDRSWSLIDILTAGTACLSEMSARLFAVTDGAIKHRDFSSPPKAVSTAS